MILYPKRITYCIIYLNNKKPKKTKSPVQAISLQINLYFSIVCLQFVYKNFKNYSLAIRSPSLKQVKLSKLSVTFRTTTKLFFSFFSKQASSASVTLLTHVIISGIFLQYFAKTSSIEPVFFASSTSSCATVKFMLFWMHCCRLSFWT